MHVVAFELESAEHEMNKRRVTTQLFAIQSGQIVLIEKFFM
jgi:hypothetical protein